MKKDKFHFYIKKKTNEYTINSNGFFQKQTSWLPRVKTYKRILWTFVIRICHSRFIVENSPNRIDFVDIDALAIEILMIL